jgi:hypothetical protein
MINNTIRSTKTAIIDIDNTLWPFSDILYGKLKGLNENFPPPEQWFNYEIWEGFCSEIDFFTVINRIHHHQDSDRHRPYPDARSFLKALKENGFAIIVASHRVPTTRTPTERWLKHHALPYDELHLSLDKTVLFPMADVVVDDAPPALKSAAACGALATGLLFPWNKTYAGDGFGLFPSLTEVCDYILSSLS